MSKKINTNTVKEGDRISFVQYYRVTEVRDNKFTVIGPDGRYIQINKPIVQTTCFTANQFTEEKQVTRTELTNIFEHAGDTIFTVMFRKKVQQDDVVDVIGTIEWLILKNTKYILKK